MTRLGYQIPSFTYPGIGSRELFAAVAAQARAADASGFDTVLVMDHFYQLPMLGEPDEYMLECYTLLAGLAAHTSRVRLSALVTGNTYRNPAMLAKVVTTLDIVSGGRGQLGIGAGWFELEHDAFGYDFGTFTDRFEKLEEALQIIKPMLAGERPTLDGAHYRVRDAINQPPPVAAIPLMIGGGGEKKTLRMVAEYADESNLICDISEVGRKLDALDAHCTRFGRDRSEITVSLQGTLCVAPTHDLALEELTGFLGRRGIDLTALDATERDAVLSMAIWGDPDAVGAQLSARLATGVDGFTLNLPANGHDPERVALAGEVAHPIVFGST